MRQNADDQTTGLRAVSIGAALLLSITAQAQPLPDQIVFGARAPILSLDPALSGLGTMHGYYDAIYSNLVQLDAETHVQPDLATSWRLVDDLTLEMKLRPGVKCHYGTPLDAASVKSSFVRLPTVPNSDGLTAGKLKLVTELQVIDPLTIRFITAEPYPGLLDVLPEFHIVCASAPATITTADFDSGKFAVGSGPYRVVRWQRGQALELERFDGFYGPKPTYAHVTLREIPNDATRMASLQAGTCRWPITSRRSTSSGSRRIRRSPSRAHRPTGPCSSALTSCRTRRRSPWTRPGGRWPRTPSRTNVSAAPSRSGSPRT